MPTFNAIALSLLFGAGEPATTQPSAAPTQDASSRPAVKAWVDESNGFRFDYPADLESQPIPDSANGVPKAMLAEPLAGPDDAFREQVQVQVLGKTGHKPRPPEYAQVVVEEMLPQLRKAG